MLTPLANQDLSLLGPNVGANKSPIKYPDATLIFPNIPETTSFWLVTNNPYFAAQEIRCMYPISGQYQYTPRVIYYVLCFLALGLRNYTWVAKASLGSIMAYSGAAAIHAIVLASIRKDMTALGYQWVDVFWGDETQPVPVWPMVLDLDCDAVLAIVGTAFFLVAPLQIWSQTFRKADTKGLFFLWWCLLLAGLICAFLNEAYIDLWLVTQYQFCPNVIDNLPSSGGQLSAPLVIDSDWNATIVSDPWE
ncbi:hypothetical protein B7494_g5232 [Chlorociboria aeruginascens]|nr:hypothetical protein B7494_g5232 [Chlorociboria aeruginascens]